MTTPTIERSVPVETYGGLRIDRYELNGQPHVQIWWGRQKSSKWHIRFQSEARREAFIRERKEWWDVNEASKAERVAARRSFDAREHFPVGTIVYSSWGYEQTNVDFYRVVKVTRQGVTLLPIKSRTVKQVGDMAAQVAPLDEPRDDAEPFWRRVTSTSIHIEGGYRYASKWDRESTYRSWYA